MTWSAVVIDRLGNDIWVRLRCEDCGLVIAKVPGYDDRNWWENFLPARPCLICAGDVPRRLGLSSLSEQVALRAGIQDWSVSQEVGRRGKRWRIYLAGTGFVDGVTPEKALRALDKELGGAVPLPSDAPEDGE